MAKNNSFIRLEGSLDGLTFFRKNGKNFVKTQSRVSKNRIMNDPAFKRTRENMQEFAGANKGGKSFRDSFASIVRTVSDADITSRVLGIMRRMMNAGAGLRGQRTLNVVDQREPFIGFNFNVNKPFDRQFNVPSDGPAITASRDTVTWTLPDFNADTYVLAPEGATHFKVVLAAGYVSNYEWVAALSAYEPVEDTPNGVGGVMYSGEIPVTGMVGSATDLTVDLTAYAPIPATTALYVGTGIVFYQEVNGIMYELAQGHCMKIAAIG